MSARFVWENFSRKKEPESLRSLLKRVPIFEDLSGRQLRALEHILHRRTYEEGEQIFAEGDEGLAMYIIETGEVTITYGASLQEITRLSSGDFFGEIGLFSSQPRSATAVAATDATVYGFSQPDLLGIIETHPALGMSVVMKLTRILAERLHRASIENKRLRDELSNYTGK